MSAVSSSVSPFGGEAETLGREIDDVGAERNSARLNDVNVRVLSSKNMFTQALPASNGPGAFRSNCAVRSKISVELLGGQVVEVDQATAYSHSGLFPRS